MPSPLPAAATIPWRYAGMGRSWRGATMITANTNPITTPFSIALPCSFSEMEPESQNHFRDQVVGRAGDTHAQSEIEFPLRSEIQIDRRKNLVLPR